MAVATKTRASDISRKKKQNFAGFSGANSRKNRPISGDFRGRKVKIRRKIGLFRGILVFGRCLLVAVTKLQAKFGHLG